MKWMVLALALLLVPTALRSEELKIEDLEGLAVEATVVYRGTFRRGDKQGPGEITVDWSLKFSPDQIVETTMVRRVKSPAGTARLARPFKGPIGRPGKVGDGNFVWILKDNDLTLLRVMEVGGQAATFKFTRNGQGWTCALDTAMAKEVGAGSSRTEAAHGGKVTILGMKQVSSTCRIKKASKTN